MKTFIKYARITNKLYGTEGLGHSKWYVRMKLIDVLNIIT